MTKVAASSMRACVMSPAASAASSFSGVNQMGRLSSWSRPFINDAAVECTDPKSDMMKPENP
jgi:hypothetical protein